jgi:tetratricopeptide (TPR) repeat protein
VVVRRVLCIAALLLAAAGCLNKADEHRVRANAFLRGNDANAALQECDLGLAARKDDLPLLILRGKALFELDRLNDARDAYRHAIEVGEQEAPDSLAEARLGLAITAGRLSDWTTARHEFEALVKENVKDGASQLNLARACLELKDMKCAIEHGEEAGRIKGNEEGTLFTLGTIYLANGQATEAEKTFQHICEVVPGAASCPYGLALVAARAGDKDKAIAALTQAVDKKVPRPDSLTTDEGFASLRDDPRFVALAARAAQAGK